jgi:hypothetical protein
MTFYKLKLYWNTANDVLCKKKDKLGMEVSYNSELQLHERKKRNKMGVCMGQNWPSIFVCLFLFETGSCYKAHTGL